MPESWKEFFYKSARSTGYVYADRYEMVGTTAFFYRGDKVCLTIHDIETISQE